ncbi:substrate-binding periplasmic protein [Kiloniella sp. b19]|uniref:substrate-binding periplasmic protein n=1 Tax=Kiloniella sp. GXU_MW_B19 TaxID=3141326 RepID=UPI0031E27434
MFLALFVVFSFLNKAALAVDDNQALIVVRDSGNYPPYEFRNSRGQLVGVHGEILAELARQTKTRLLIRDVPWKRALAMMQDGRADILLYARRTAERLAYMDFIEGTDLLSVNNSFFIQKDRQSDVLYDGAIESLRPYTIGVMRGFDYGGPINSTYGLKKDLTDNGVINLVRKLETGRIDVAIIDRNIVGYFQKEKLASPDLLPIGDVYRPIKIYMAVSKKSDRAREAYAFVRSIADFKKTEKYKEIMKKYQSYLKN